MSVEKPIKYLFGEVEYLTKPDGTVLRYRLGQDDLHRYLPRIHADVLAHADSSTLDLYVHGVSEDATGATRACLVAITHDDDHVVVKIREVT